MKMIGIFVNSSGVNYAELIASGLKRIETRTRNVFKNLAGRRVAVIETGKGAARVIGYVDIIGYWFCSADEFPLYRYGTKIPAGDKFERYGKHNGTPGKWFYNLANAEKCDPYPLPENAIRHGRSYCEF